MIAFLGASLMLITVTEYKLAEIYLFVHAICASSSVIATRRLTQGEGALNPLVVATLSFVIGTVVMFISFIVTWLTFIPFVQPIQTWEQSIVGTYKLIGTLYILQVCYAVTFVVMCWCFSHGAIVKVAMYVSSRPIFAFIINLTYDETTDISQHKLYACVGLMIAGFFIAFVSKKREQLRKLRADRKRSDQIKQESLDPFKRKLLP
jgi:drug/metabolite transporter (DMT)-like permease